MVDSHFRHMQFPSSFPVAVEYEMSDSKELDAWCLLEGGMNLHYIYIDPFVVHNIDRAAVASVIYIILGFSALLIGKF